MKKNFIKLITDEEENEALKNTYIGRGFKQGEKKRNIDIAKAMLNDNLSIDAIAKYNGLTEEEITIYN